MPEHRKGAKARWSPIEQAKAVEVYRERRALEQQFPALSLHVYANFHGVHCHAAITSMTPDGRLRRVVIAQASWRPPEVNERLVVEWGRRALAAWLEATLPVPEDPS